MYRRDGVIKSVASPSLRALAPSYTFNLSTFSLSTFSCTTLISTTFIRSIPKQKFFSDFSSDTWATIVIKEKSICISQHLDNSAGHVDILRRREQVLCQRQAGSVPGSNHPVSGRAATSGRHDQDWQDAGHFCQQLLLRSEVFLQLHQTRYEQEISLDLQTFATREGLPWLKIWVQVNVD